jgi:hypothetical protein
VSAIHRLHSAAPGAIAVWAWRGWYVSVNWGVCLGLGPFAVRACDGVWVFGLSLGLVVVAAHQK